MTTVTPGNDWHVEILVDDDGDLNIAVSQEEHGCWVAEDNGDYCMADDKLHYRFFKVDPEDSGKTAEHVQVLLDMLKKAAKDQGVILLNLEEIDPL